jgi:hypothetical protein
MHVIFSRLEFKDKISAGQVCRDWGNLLKAGTADARHWNVNYNVDAIVTSAAFEATKSLPPPQQTSNYIERCVNMHTPSV